MEKQILDGYTGVKFTSRCLDTRLPPGGAAYRPFFKQNGKLLLEQGMAPANGGNMSAAWGKGFFITASESNLGCIEDDEIVFVENFSIEERFVEYRGSRLPSSETFLHGLLYREKSNIFSVVHAHDQIATAMDISRFSFLDETDREEPYGTVELAECCLQTFEKE